MAHCTMGAIFAYGSGSRRIPVATRRIPGTYRLPRAQSPHSARTRQGGPHGDGQRHRTHGEADEGRHGEALLGARHQHHPGRSTCSSSRPRGSRESPSRSPSGRSRAWKSRTGLPHRPSRPRNPFAPKWLRPCKQNSCAITRLLQLTRAVSLSQPGETALVARGLAILSWTVS